MQKVAVSASLRLHMTEQDHTPKSDKNRDMTKHYKSKEAGDFFEGYSTKYYIFSSLNSGCFPIAKQKKVHVCLLGERVPFSYLFQIVASFNPAIFEHSLADRLRDKRKSLIKSGSGTSNNSSLDRLYIFSKLIEKAPYFRSLILAFN